MTEWYIVWFIIVAIALAAYMDYRKNRKKRRLAFIENYTFPQRVEESVLKAYPHLNEKDAKIVMDGLREYFAVACLADGKMVSMPSQAVDVAWHEFLLFTRRYQKFCQKAFGRYFHHHPVEAMKSKTVAQEGIKRTWKLACRRENISPTTPHKLPLLFALDASLEIPDGFRYALDCTKTKGGEYCASHIGCGGGGCAGGCGGHYDGCQGGCSGGCGGGCGGS